MIRFWSEPASNADQTLLTQFEENLDVTSRWSGRPWAPVAGQGWTLVDTYAVERCEMRYEDRFEDRVEGYRVVYEYRDRRGVTRLSYDPDDRIRVPSERRYRDDDDD